MKIYIFSSCSKQERAIKPHTCVIIAVALLGLDIKHFTGILGLVVPCLMTVNNQKSEGTSLSIPHPVVCLLRTFQVTRIFEQKKKQNSVHVR